MGLVVHAVTVGRTVCDVRVVDGTIVEISSRIVASAGDEVLEGARGSLIPGLHDHHVHLLALAAARGSVDCGPPAARSEMELRRKLASAAAHVSRDGWVRGVNYHESVAGLPDRRRLDAWCPTVPLRVQHRSGALWVLNGAAIDRLDLGKHRSDSIERDPGGAPTGRIWRGDALLHRLLGREPPSFTGVGRELASVGITSVTDATPTSSSSTLAVLAAAQSAAELPQRLRVMGPLGLDESDVDDAIAVGEVKILLDDDHLPNPDDLAHEIRSAHRARRAVAIHCVTHVQLVVAIAALRVAGPQRDRIEHANVAHSSSIAGLRQLEVAVVAQPGFIAGRGDQYLRDVEDNDQPALVPLRSLLRAGVAVGASTDAPYTAADPWRAMRAAVARETDGGRRLGWHERIDPERALDLFLGRPEDVRAGPRRVAVGAAADLVLLERPWRDARRDLDSEDVAATIIDGTVVYRK